jgi:hypothetical protein
VLLGDARTRVAELMGDHAHGDAATGKSRRIRVALSVERGRWFYSGPTARLCEGPYLMRLTPRLAVIAREDEVARLTPDGDLLEQGSALVSERDMPGFARLAGTDADRTGLGVEVCGLEAR